LRPPTPPRPRASGRSSGEHGRAGRGDHPPGGDIYLLGTAQTEQTVYKEYHEEKGYELRIWPIVYPVPNDDPKLDELRKYGPLLAPSLAKALADNPHLAGTSVEPTRFTEGDILQREKEWGRIEFARQFKMFMDAGVGKGAPLKLRDLVVMELGSSPGASGLLLPSEVIFPPRPANQAGDRGGRPHRGQPVYAPEKVDAWIKPEKVVCIVDTSGAARTRPPGRLALSCWAACSCCGREPPSRATPSAPSRRSLRTASGGASRQSRSRRTSAARCSGSCSGRCAPTCSTSPRSSPLPAKQVQKEVRIVENLEPLASSHRLVVNAELLRRDFHVDYEDVEAAKRRYYRLTYQFSRMTKAKGASRTMTAWRASRGWRPTSSGCCKGACKTRKSRVRSGQSRLRREAMIESGEARAPPVRFGNKPPGSAGAR
jgi:hypothetical protein